MRAENRRSCEKERLKKQDVRKESLCYNKYRRLSFCVHGRSNETGRQTAERPKTDVSCSGTIAGDAVMKFQMNFTTSQDDVQRYASAEDLRGFYRKYGLNGLEVMPLPCERNGRWAPPDTCPLLQPDMVVGVHTCSIADWMGMERGSVAAHYRRDLQYAERMGAEYVVFHVTQISAEESWTYRMTHTDEEVIDASCSLINELLDGQGYSFWFLMENLWWPGLTFRSPACTGRLLDGVHYEKKGLMLDTGHYMHTDPAPASEEAVAALHAMLDRHGELVSRIKGLHIHQSLTGAYVRDWLSAPGPLPEDPEERFCKMYEHIFAIDRHEPFTAPGLSGLVERIAPLYATYEYITRDREEHGRYLEKGLLRRKFVAKSNNNKGIAGSKRR